jgi:serine/threonine protein kinase
MKVAEVGGLAARLDREVQALRSCEHPSVARILDAFPHTEAGSEHLIVIEEYLAGGTLEGRMATAPIAAEDVHSIGTRLAEVLGHLRERNLVHRDIKPANILFRDAGAEPVLTDFGIVRDLNAPTLTADFMGMGPGTPAFAAPEQLANEKALIDWRTDQFDLALVLAHCVLGRHAYQRTPTENIRDAIRRVAAKEHVPAENRLQLEAAGFGSLVRALEPWPVGRYRRPEDLVRALA